MRIGNRMFRCVYVYEFPDNSAYVGLTYNLEMRNNSRKLQPYDAVTRHIAQTKLKPNLKQLTTYITTNEASLLEHKYIIEYKKNGWKVLNKTKGGEIGSAERIWTKELCLKEALKYTVRSDFYYYSNNIYSAACRYGWLDEICLHMNKIKIRWTKELCLKEALKYDTRNEFQRNSHNSYVAAHRHNWLDEICSHMKPKRKPPNYWTYEKCKEIALCLNNKTEFSVKYSGAYDKAINNKWINDFFPIKI
jgi:hypothetical protein